MWGLIIGAVVLGIISLILLVLLFLYNRLIALKNRIDNAWAQIDVQLQRRADLIPNLVKTVKGYAKHEKSVFENVTKARSAMLRATTVEGKAKASNMLSETLKSLFAVSEAYPDLKANKNFMMLQEELSGLENKVAYTRTAYNDTVLEFNQTIELIPFNFLAAILSYKKRPYFEAEEAKKAVPKVSFD